MINELSDAGGLKPTTTFKKVYGNYCGPGNRGGDPVDGLDAACQNHDKCYHHIGRDCVGCDSRFIQSIDAFLKSGKITFKQYLYANAAKAYYKKKLVSIAK